MNINIIVDNPITARIGTGLKQVRPLLTYKSKFYRKNRFGKTISKIYDKHVISSSGSFYLGLAATSADVLCDEPSRRKPYVD